MAGDTYHFEAIADTTTRALMDVGTAPVPVHKHLGTHTLARRLVYAKTPALCAVPSNLAFPLPVLALGVQPCLCKFLALLTVGLSTGVPIIFGVLTVNTEEQAIYRSMGDNNHGTQWGKAAVEMALLRASATGGVLAVHL